MAFSFQTPPPQAQQPLGSPFQTPQPQPQPSLFQTPQQQATPFPSFGQQSHFQLQQQPQPQQLVQFQMQQSGTAAAAPQQQLLLLMKDKAPVGYNTKFEDLHPDTQKLLIQIEERIREYKDESQRLEQCSRLNDSSVLSDSFELDANRIEQELGGIANAMEREKVSIQRLSTSMNKMMWDTEFAVRSYMILRQRFLRLNPQSATNVAPGNMETSAQTSQLVTNLLPTYDFYSGLPKRPSVFMEQTVARFETYLIECCQWIEEVEQLLRMDIEKTSSSSVEALPKVMSNVHDFFIHVAAKVESLHQYVESMKSAYLADQRRRGDGSDPFLEANRREVAKKEAAARRVHPTLHLPRISLQPTTQVAGVCASSPALNLSQPSAGASAASSGSGFSSFNTPSSAPAASSSSFLFSTPTASAPSSGLFGSTAFSPQSTPFGTASTSLFGSTPAPSGFGTSSSFGSSLAGGSSLFYTPLSAAGAATGSGASFGPSKSSRPKTRTSRR